MEAEQILKVAPEECHRLLRTLEGIAFGGTARGEGGLVTLHKIYEVFIVGLLERGLFIESIPYLYRVLAIEPPLPHLGIVYVMLLLARIAAEFNEESRKCLFRLAAVLFFEPLQLLKAVDFAVNTKLTGLEQTHHLREILAKESASHANFASNNPVLSKYFCENHKNPRTKEVV
jgi:hypothetical protein